MPSCIRNNCINLELNDANFKKNEIAWIRSDTGSDENAIEPPLLELAFGNRFRGFAKVRETHLHAVPEARQFLIRGIEACRASENFIGRRF